MCYSAKNNLNLRTKTEPVTTGADAAVYCPAFVSMYLAQKPDIYRCTWFNRDRFILFFGTVFSYTANIHNCYKFFRYFGKQTHSVHGILQNLFFMLQRVLFRWRLGNRHYNICLTQEIWKFHNEVVSGIRIRPGLNYFAGSTR